MATRLYKVKSEKGTRLIEAGTSAAALGFVARGEIAVTVATAKEAAELVGQGVKVEQAKEVAATE
jgi:hypothetical protein